VAVSVTKALRQLAELLAQARITEYMIKEDKELSAVARACILSTGDPRVTGILQSA
jgi:precorrin-6B methylase 1